MQTIKATTKAGSKYIDMYNRAKCATLYQAYKTPSTDKTRADYQCRAQMAKEDGHGYKVISSNTYMFSVAWQTSQGLRIETPARSILVTE